MNSDITDNSGASGVKAERRPRLAVLAGWTLAAAALMAGCASYHAWNRGLLDEAQDKAPDGVNLVPIEGEPGAYAVNPAFDAILSVYLVEDRLPTAEDAPREMTELDKSAWSFDEERSVLLVTVPVDLGEYFVSVQGNFAYPLVFTLPKGTEPDSIRVIMEGKLCLPGSGFAYDEESRRLTLLGTSADTEWFCLGYDAGDDSGAISSNSTGRLTRAMRAHMGFPTDGNCEAVDGSGRRFRVMDGYAPEGATPWMLELLPVGEGYVGTQLWPDAFSFDPATGVLELAEPVDAARFSVFALVG